MKVVGITGSIGTGKTSVARMFARWGAKVIDADKLSHQAIQRRGPITQTVIKEFGQQILGRRNNIDRGKLAKLVFSDSRKLKKLCLLLHPWVITQMKKKIVSIKRQNPTAKIVIDAPLLLEAGLRKMFDYLVVVRANTKNQMARCLKRACASRKDFFLRKKNQLPMSKKMQMADFIIDNNGKLKQTQTQARKIWLEIKRED